MNAFVSRTRPADRVRTSLELKPLPSLFDTMQVWGAITASHTFIVTCDEGRFLASVRDRTVPWAAKIMLSTGWIDSFEDAVALCEKFARDEVQ